VDAWKFGTYWRDSISGLDYADQRYYSSLLGRFLTPDLFGGGAGHDPQGWNRYSYSLNDPVNDFDPTGKNAVCVTKVDEGDDDSSTECFGGDGSGGSANGTGGAAPVQTFGGAQTTFTVTGYSRSGAKESTITNDLNDILNQVLTGGCAKWLTGQDFSASQLIAALETAVSGGPSYGYGAVNSNTLAAFVGNTNPNGTPVTGLPVNASITVNTNGAFFNSGYTVGFGNTQYTGGTLQAQIFILVHELAHLVGAAGFLSDAGSQDNVNSNNALVQQNCGKQIAGVQ
jgi:RHS repeat-associated protein